MAKRSEHSPEELKALVLNAGESIIVEEGFSALTVRKIAVKIGYTVGSIYMVFKNMADLTMQINESTLDAISAALKLVQEPSPEQSIEAIALAYLSYANHNFYRWHNVFKNPLSSTTENPITYQKKLDNVFFSFETFLKELAPERPDDFINRAGHALGFGIQGICLASLSNKLDDFDIDDIQETISLLVRCFIQGWAMDLKK